MTNYFIMIPNKVLIFVRDREERSRNEESINESRNEESINETNVVLDLLENIKIIKEDLKYVYLGALDSSQLWFSKSDRPLFMNLLLKYFK